MQRRIWTIGLATLLIGVATAWAGAPLQRPPLVAPFDEGPMLVDYSAGTGEILRGAPPGMQAAADHIVSLQCPDGLAGSGWGWPHTCPPMYHNITAPIAMGLLQAHAMTADPDHIGAAVAGGTFDLSGTGARFPNNSGTWFSSYTPAFFWRLSNATGNAAYSNNAAADFFDRLTAGTYGDPAVSPYWPGDTYDFIARLQAGRSGSQINLRPWDLHNLPWVAGLIGNADSTTPLDGVSQQTAFRNALLDGLDTLDQTSPATVWWDMIGLVGGVRGLALNGTTSFPAIVAPNFTPINGINNLCDLANVLAGYQNTDGSWSWSSTLQNPVDPTDKDTQITAYAVMALAAADPYCTDYADEIAKGRQWLRSMQLPGGGFQSYPGGGENVEVEAEALNALAPAVLVVDDDGFGSELDCDATVPCYATISAAVAAAIPGDIIKVCPGTYNENVAINKALTLLGDPGDPLVAGPGPGAPFLDGTGLPPGDAFTILNGVSDVAIQGFKIAHYATDPLGNGVGNAVQAWNDGTSNVSIRDNEMYDLGWNGVLVGNSGTGLHSNWTVSNNVIVPCWIGVELTNCGNSVVENNVISGGGCWPGDYPPNGWVIGVLLQARSFSAEGGNQSIVMSDVSVRNNDITALGAATLEYGMYLVAYGDGSPGWTATLSGVQIGGPGNDLNNNATYGIVINGYNGGAGWGTGGTIDGVAIQGNDILANGTGIRVIRNSLNISASDNNIVGNTLGVQNQAAATVDAEFNNWGAASGPLDANDDTFETTEVPACTASPQTERNVDGAGNAVSDTSTTAVDYCPWLSLGGSGIVTLTPNATCYAVGDTVTVTVVLSAAPVPIVGGQFFLDYDNTRLDFLSAGPGSAPFTVQVYESVSEGAGTIDYAVGVVSPDPGATSGTMAVITFTAIGEICSATGLVTFRDHNPPTRLSDGVGGAVVPELVALSLVSIDGTAPTLQDCPAPDITAECNAIPPALPVKASDNCDTEVPVTLNQVTTAGPCDDSYIITRTWTATDGCGNTATCQQVIHVQDTTPPTISPLASNLTVECDGFGNAAELSAWLAGNGGAAATDNCGGVTWTNNFAGLSDLCGATGSAMLTFTATDACGNFSTTTATFTIQDTTAPVITACPGNITVYADAGGCTAVVTWTAPTAADTCGMGSFVSTHNPGDTFPQGLTMVTYTATDACGHVSTCSFGVSVLGLNQMVVNVQLQPTMVVGPITRCITFELWDCPGAAPLTTEPEVFNFTNGSASATVNVLCGAYDCITARDTLHTLRRTATLVDAGTQYTTSFTGADQLVGGNLNDDFWIDILDFGTYSFQWAMNYGSGNTTCSTPYPHADINGNGSVGTEDFTFIQINFLQSHELNCCGASGFRDGEGEDGPITEITVAELAEMGLGHLAVGDLNNDGWLDQEDIAAFLMGARPGLAEGDPQPVDATDITEVGESAERPAAPPRKR